MLFCNFIHYLTVIYDANVLGKVEQPDIKKRNDLALWLRTLKENKGFQSRCYPEVVAQYSVNNDGLSANKLSGIVYWCKCMSQYADLGVLKSSFFTFATVLFKAVKTLSPQAYNLVVTKIL